MSISHWGIFPGLFWERHGVRKWRVLSFDFIAVLLLVVPLTGCLTLEEQRAIDETYRFRFYSKSEVDALNARSECRLLARNLVQIARCDGR